MRSSVSYKKDEKFGKYQVCMKRNDIKEALSKEIAR